MNTRPNTTSPIPLSTSSSKQSAPLLHSHTKIKDTEQHTHYKPEHYIKNDYILNSHQEYSIFHYVIKNTPKQMGLQDTLWSNESTQRLIAEKLRLSLPLHIINLYLKQWGITPQNSLQYAYEEHPQRLRQWLKTEYVSIRKKAEQEEAVLFWINQKTIENKLIRYFNEKTQHHTLTVFSAHTNTSKTLYSIHAEQPSPLPSASTFCNQIVAMTPQKCLFILDQDNEARFPPHTPNHEVALPEMYFLPS